MNENRKEQTHSQQYNGILKEQMEMQKKRHESEVANLKSSLANLKGEHVFSLKNDLENTTKDKISMHVKLKEVQDQLQSKEKKVNTLKNEMKDIQSVLHSRNNKMNQLVNAMSLMQEENQRLSDIINP